MIWKRLTLILLCLLLLLLASGSVVGAMWGEETARKFCYTSPWTLLLWSLLALAGCAWLTLQRRHCRPAALAFHIGLLVVLAGAAVTHCCGIQGTLTLQRGAGAATRFRLADGSERALPFAVTLADCRTLYYAGTSTPCDFESRIDIIDPDGGHREGRISMNHIFTHRHWRFYQTGMSADSSTLTLSHDPWGIGLTYAGYLALLFAALWLCCDRRSRLRVALRSPLLRRAACMALLLGATLSAQGAERPLPRTLQRGLAKEFGRICVEYNGRICPVQTLARDFCTQVHGKNSYRGLTAEQVLTGWIFYYEDWRSEPIILVDDDDCRERLGIKGKYAALTDFYSRDGYLLDDAMADDSPRRLRNIDARVQLVSLICTGRLLRVFPLRGSSSESLGWYSWVDTKPAEAGLQEWHFATTVMNDVAEMVHTGHNVAAAGTLQEIRRFQQRIAGTDALPSPLRIEAERLYNASRDIRFVLFLWLTLGLWGFFVVCRSFAVGQPLQRGVVRCLQAGAALLCLYTGLTLALRGYVGGYCPLSDGFETMYFLAFAAGATALGLSRKMTALLPPALLAGSAALGVAGMSEAQTGVTLLQPVLASPLLSVHVVVVMLAYALFFFTMWLGVAALALKGFGNRASGDTEAVMLRLQALSRALLYPAVLLLTAGIFIGAVWANLSWGRYWGWDPKEVWALVTLFVYAAPLHTTSLPRLQQPIVFHTYCTVAFLTILVTYFGVNHLLGGLHSYAS